MAAANELVRIDAQIVPSLQRSVREVLDDAHALAREMSEARALCDHVLQRLEVVVAESVDVMPPPPPAARHRYAAIVEEFAAFLGKFAGERAVYRVVHHRIVVRATLAAHEAIDHLLHGLRLPHTNRALADWQDVWEHLRADQTRALDTLARDRALLLGDSRAAPTEALSFLVYELTRVGGSEYSNAELQVLTNAFDAACSVLGDTMPTIAPWLLPPYEFTYNGAAPFAWGSASQVHVGTLCSSATPVAVKFVTPASGVDPAAVGREASMWHRARGIANVVTLHGASDVSTPPYFVCEYAAHGTLSDYLTSAAHRQWTWHLLLDVATGLGALHDLGILHNDLKGEHVVVVAAGMDVTAKITGFGLATEASAPEAALLPDHHGALAWTAPEVLAKTRPPSVQSDVYSLGMCILEAVTHALPWTGTADVTVRLLVQHGKLPMRPADGFDDDQWALVEHMCAHEPDDRLPLHLVLERLRLFANREANRQHARRPSFLDAAPALEGDDDDALRAAELTAAISPPHAPLPLGAFDASLRTRRAALQSPEMTSALPPPQSSAFDPAASLPLSNFEWGAQSQSEPRRSPRPSRRSSIEKVPSVAPEPSPPAPATTTRAPPSEALVRSACITNARFVTLEGTKQIVQYEVAIQLTAGKDVLVWKRFSAFRYALGTRSMRFRLIDASYDSELTVWRRARG